TALRDRYLIEAAIVDNGDNTLGFLQFLSGPEGRNEKMGLKLNLLSSICWDTTQKRGVIDLQEHIIENNHILYLGKKENDMLSQLQKTSRVSISEIIRPGKASLEIKGAWADVIEVVMKIEPMLCEVQEEMAKKRSETSGACPQPKNWDEMKEITFRKCVVVPTPEIQDKRNSGEDRQCGSHGCLPKKEENDGREKERGNCEPSSATWFAELAFKECTPCPTVGVTPLNWGCCMWELVSRLQQTTHH
ncbi:hypothetical protein HPG69_010460, partial [Diceros bicornis minor]